MGNTLEDIFLDYVQRSRILKLDYLAEEWDCDMGDITELICMNHDSFDNVTVFRKAVHLDWADTDRWYYEIAKGGIYKGKHTLRRHRYIEAEHITEQIDRSAGQEDRHMSVFMHDDKWVEEFSDKNSLVRPAFIYLELDRDGDIEHALQDANYFFEQFPYHRGCGVWFSGNASVHIGIPAEYFGSPITINADGCGRGHLYYNLARMAGGNIRYDNEYFDPHLSGIDECKQQYEELFGVEPPDDPQQIRQKLEHFDPNLYYMNSLIRLPKSVHEKSGNRKEFIDLPNFDPDNAPEIKPWLLEWTYHAWEPVVTKKTGTNFANVSKKAPFVIQFYAQHIEGFDPEECNSSGWLGELHSPFYEDHNPSVSVCVDPEDPRFGAYKDFGNADDNTDFVGFVSRIIGKSRRAAKEYIKVKSKKIGV